MANVAPDHKDDSTQAPEPAASTEGTTPAQEKVTLTLTGPFHLTEFRVPQADGSTLVIDRRGTDVPADEASNLVTTAKQYGVTLSRKKN